MHRTTILLAFFLSGTSALIYQLAWVRQATLVFGVSIYAYSAVLAAFMGGSAIGSYLAGQRADQTTSPLRIYALLQFGIALFGALTPLILLALMPLYGSVAQTLPTGSALVTLIRALFSILVLVPPTLLMGATLPVVARALNSHDGRVGSDVGQLYAADTLGAAIGCMLTGLFLLRILGTQQTVFVGVVLNLSAASLAWLLSRKEMLSDAKGATSSARKKGGKKERKSKTCTDESAKSSPLIPGFVLWAYAISGFTALGYEVAWARILAIFTLDAVFSFAIMLTTFLTGLTVGGWIGSWWTRSRVITLTLFVKLQIGAGLTSLLTLFVFARLPGLNLEELFGQYSVQANIYYEFLLGFITLFVPTVLIGMLYPVVVSLYSEEQSEQIGAKVGRLNAYNTAGAVLGSLVVGFGIIPIAGLQATVAILAVVNLIIGLVASWLPLDHTMQDRVVPQLGMALGVALILLLPNRYYLGFREGPSEHMIFYEEGVETTVAVFEVPEENFKVSFVNGRIEVPTDEISMNAFRLLGHLPPLLKPDAERALMLSFGNGIATGSLDTHGIPHIDAVDLSAEQFAAAELYWEENYNVLRSPRLNMYVEDGRNFLLQTPHRYDIITTDATHPVNTSSWALFTQEFYQSVAHRLADGGVFLQWMPFHNLLESDYKMILRTFQSVFPHTTLWYTGGSHTLFLATSSPLTEERLTERLDLASDNAIVADDLGSALVVRQYLAMDGESVREYIGSGALSTDNNAYFLPQDRDMIGLLETMESAVARRTEYLSSQD